MCEHVSINGGEKNWNTIVFSLFFVLFLQKSDQFSFNLSISSIVLQNSYIIIII